MQGQRHASSGRGCQSRRAADASSPAGQPQQAPEPRRHAACSMQQAKALAKPLWPYERGRTAAYTEWEKEAAKGWGGASEGASTTGLPDGPPGTPAVPLCSCSACAVGMRPATVATTPVPSRAAPLPTLPSTEESPRTKPRLNPQARCSRHRRQQRRPPRRLSGGGPPPRRPRRPRELPRSRWTSQRTRRVRS